MKQAEFNEIMDGMEKVLADETKQLEARAPRCHLKPMSYEMGEDESWWECKHCGHTKPV